MSDTPDDLIAEEDIPFFMLDEWTKCYIALDSLGDTCKHLDAAGLENYYVLAMEKNSYVETTGTTSTTTVTYNPQVFAINSTICYRAISPVAKADIPLEEKTAAATFTLPRIPAKIVNQLDDFFRLVDRKYGTESIVLLTFDPSAVDEDGKYTGEGWDVLVPDQENTATDCEYDPTTAASKKDDDVYIVGSVHSHPGMSAFASGTDHKDQKHFDGLHITYGWQSSVQNGATQYHIELQINGQVWTLRPDQVFEGEPARTPDPSVEEWMENVKKKTYNTGYQTGSYPKHGSTTGTSSHSSGGSLHRSLRLQEVKGLPAGAPDWKDNLIIGRLKSVSEDACPFCNQPLITPDRTNRLCTACHQYLAMPGESVEEVFRVRQDEQLYSWDLDIEENPKKPIVVWERDEDESKFTNAYTPAGKE